MVSKEPKIIKVVFDRSDTVEIDYLKIDLIFFCLSILKICQSLNFWSENGWRMVSIFTKVESKHIAA